jgi:hypothetical protein
MKKLPLPPLVGGFEDGHVTWDRLESIDYDTLGYLLSCHLIIEHYMDHFLAAYPGTPIFGWENAKLSFTQKIALIGALPFSEPYNLPPVIKHLNVLRNRFGHNINTKLTETDLLPIREFLVKCITGESEVHHWRKSSAKRPKVNFAFVHDGCLRIHGERDFVWGSVR